jgi:ATP-dependent exoDNAse (exonuclease V) alpha subunit
MDSGKEVSFDPKEMRHFDHGYAVTSHSSQGLTSACVLVNMDTEVHPELINARFAYVSVSRASQDAQVFTNDAANLAQSISKEVSKTSAINLENETVLPNPGSSRTQVPAATIAAGLHLSR